jgi:DNA polymerase I-like protein with 3'-5' exonuclease and polymerase domains
MELFRELEITEYQGGWSPEAPPCLDGIHEIELDCEATGLRWWEKDRPIGIAVQYGDKKQYLPWGHRGGGNLDEAIVKQWAERELRGKKITNLNTGYDNHMLYAWGIDLEAQGCILSDVGHYAALLDDHRVRFSLEDISQDWLGRGKIGQELNKKRMADYHAGQVAPYACVDVELVHDLKEVMLPEIKAQGLEQVLSLEEEIIYVVCEMERNGAPLDLELLTKWAKEAEQEFLRCLWKIHRNTGIKFEPTTKGWIKLFEHEKIPIQDYTDKGAPSFTDDVLKRIKNENIQTGRRAARLKSLKSKYLDNYLKRVGPDGILRYALHQLRSIKDEYDDSSDIGAVTGRFSSTEIDDDIGTNIQQVMKVAKQRVLFGFDEDDSSHDDEIFIVRRLIKPQVGDWLSADAMQIEYRHFANLVESERIFKEYEQDPRANFHKMVHTQLKALNPNLTYRQCKDLNFARLYGGGLAKLALMMGFISKTQWENLKKEFTRIDVLGRKQTRIPNDHPLLEEARKVDRIYNETLPEAGKLQKMAMDVAKNRGYVKSIMGRRSRFPKGWRLHKALNSVIQPSCADIMKTKLVELHKERKTTGFKMRFTVHDEVDGDAQTPETPKKVAEILDKQSFPLRIPILWDVSTGKNWKEAS